MTDDIDDFAKAVTADSEREFRERLRAQSDQSPEQIAKMHHVELASPAPMAFDFIGVKDQETLDSIERLRTIGVLFRYFLDHDERSRCLAAQPRNH